MKIGIGGGRKAGITQNPGDLKAGYFQNDYSRISAYIGKNQGVHTGNNSPTVGRHNQPFGK